MSERELLSGHLVKRAVRNNKTWKRRYFVLTDAGNLSYFKSDSEARDAGGKTNLPRGVFTLNGATIKPTQERAFGIEISMTDVTLVVAAESQADQIKWLEALQKSIDIVASKPPAIDTSYGLPPAVASVSSASTSASASSGGGFLKRLTGGGRRRRSSTGDDSDDDGSKSGTSSHGKTHTFQVGGANPTTFECDVRYTLIRSIGQGAYGVVISCNDAKNPQEKVAIKKVSKAFDDLVDAKRILREIKLLRHFDHENIIHIKDLFISSAENGLTGFNEIYIVSELMETDLHRVIYSRQPLSEDHIQYFVYQILRALKYIHSAGVVHRDLKPSNLLLNSTCDLKVCDFGLARGLSDVALGLTEYVVTRWYRAPEIMLACKEYTRAIDVWSVGCIFAELLGRKPLFPGDNYLHQLELIAKVVGTPQPDDLHFVTSDKALKFMRNLAQVPKADYQKLYPKAPKEALELLDLMLKFDPTARITVIDALAHPYFASLHHPDDEPLCPSLFEMKDDVPDDKLKRVDIQCAILEEVFKLHPELESVWEKQLHG